MLLFLFLTFAKKNKLSYSTNVDFIQELCDAVAVLMIMNPVHKHTLFCIYVLLSEYLTLCECIPYVMSKIIITILFIVQHQHHVQSLGECAVMGHELEPVQLSVNTYMGNITYLRCPSILTYNFHFIYSYIQSTCVDSYSILIYFNLAPND